MIYYIYVYLDPRKPGSFIYGKHHFTHEPFYVGKGSNKRLTAHLQPNNLKEKSPKNWKIKKMLVNNIKPIIIKIIDNIIMESVAFDLEIKTISEIGRKDKNKGPLLNLNDGGLGATKSEETKEKISKTKKRLYATNQIVHPMLGKTHTEESKIKMRNSHVGIQFSQDHLNNIAIARKKFKCNFTKSWELTSPTGQTHIVYGLGQFCREHNLSQPHMFQVAVGKRNHHKGWQCKHLD